MTEPPDAAADASPAIPGDPAGQREFVTFAQRSTSALLERLQARLKAARRDRSVSAVHGLRVASRRLVAALDCFRAVIDRAQVRKLRKRIRGILVAAGAVRDRDIALTLAEEAGLEPESPVVAALRRRRDDLAENLDAVLSSPASRKLSLPWQ